ncbi:antifreeze protein [Sulfitobacter sp. M57]|uniref:antifreeze protein n=1 Tax=unclassified Sulfitobacter TaxID=196795 RepID=UPI0023E16163|nr:MULTISPECIES: antifreeze protein [unclassified Sulfitobacter]MDF3414488.1 antifreeze protein [Sulfitobacter sp. KE5]MDF3421969.1 antifreeze protein [Sulfitobacter sp. KE43]MDF3433034.1 antifreeze protein [Sulfitobacter sp. KE42]MDF3458674.1 antifreeze protein [Sulfitobacter sp. S74]MDF3462574.1 antifreeze protein [Sulfitobacter sp. Ks18]
MFPSDLFSLQLKLTTLMAETQTVMALRLMGMSGAIPAKRGENQRMVDEKGPAMAKAFAAANKAMLEGRRPDQIMTAAIAPVSRRVTSNRKRLMK